ncbi:hypothetical protein IWX90DRAFT_482514 [Phyllosticta citrichinensis]|uniref:Uncharacterized protein n=1 Tax=Phyllosticta citrichinensis TaxID=1130410 RepID=A0ABR1Y7E6_9PEZI
MSSNTTNTTDKNDDPGAPNAANTLSSNPDILDRSQLSRTTQLPTHNVFRLPKKTADNARDGDDALNTTTDTTTTTNTTINVSQPSSSGGGSSGTHLPMHNVLRPPQHSGNVASGLEATLNNPNVPEERKEEAKERLDGTSTSM